MSNISGEGILTGQIFGVSDVIDYNNLTNRPKINNKVVEGDHNGRYYGLTESEVIDWIDYFNLPEETKKNGKIYYIRNAETYVEKTITNVNVASFNDGSQNPLKSLILDINLVQEGSGPPAPDNIRPLRGRNTAEVTAAGINVWDQEVERGSIDNTTGELITFPTLFRCKNKIHVVGGQTYYFSSNYGCLVYQYRADDSYIRYTDNVGNIIKNFTVENDTDYIRIRLFSNVTDPALVKLSINYPSSNNSYNEYTGTTKTISLGQTVYGGVLNVTTGGLTVTDGYIASYNGEILPSTWISDRDVYAPNTTPTIGAEVVYKLTTPIEITLPATEVTILSGANNIWTNEGIINELKYLSPTGAIENQIRTNDEIFGRG